MTTGGAPGTGAFAAAHCVIVGGGVIGAATACFLVNDPGFAGRVTVIEKDPSYAEASTTRSVGGIRHQFSTPANIRMSLFASEFVRNPARHVRTDRRAGDLSFVENGYLMLASQDGAPTLHDNVTVQRQLGADIEILDAHALARRFDWLNVDGVACGALGRRGEGWIDPHSLLMLFRESAIAGGARFLADSVAGLERRGDKLIAATLGGGERVPGDVFVNAAGPAAAEICRLAACTPPPVTRRKRQVFVFHCRSPIARCPLVVDPGGMYFRPEGAQFICGLSPPPGNDPDCADFDIDHDWFEQRIWPVLAHRVPAFDAIRVTGAWAGHYDYNTFDQNAIIGHHGELTNFLLANGFSGHGLQQSPAVGRAIAELITDGGFRTLDLSVFSPERIARRTPVVERNVV